MVMVCPVTYHLNGECWNPPTPNPSHIPNPNCNPNPNSRWFWIPRIEVRRNGRKTLFVELKFSEIKGHLTLTSATLIFRNPIHVIHSFFVQGRTVLMCCRAETGTYKQEYCRTFMLVMEYDSSKNLHKKRCRSYKWGTQRNTISTKKLCYRKDDRAMHPIHGCPENCRDSWLHPLLLFPTFFTGLCSDRPYECSYKIWSP